MSGKYWIQGAGLACLVVLLALTRVHAQPMGKGADAPAATSSSPAPYSPTVSFEHLPALQVSTPKPGSPHVALDFNGDGTSDLLWFNPALSQLGYWLMDATTPGVGDSGNGVTRIGSRTFNVTAGYFVGASGDFNHDGYADLVFTSAKRDLWLWTNRHDGTFTSTQIGSYPDRWQLVGAGDIDGDGDDDLLWEDPSDCEFAYWLMKGGTRVSSKVIPIACGYYPIVIGYYSPSNRLSIFWTSDQHDLFVWDSTGTGFKTYDMSPYVNTPYFDLAHIWAIGGGYMGSGIGIEVYVPDAGGGPVGSAKGGVYSRTFDANGNQTGFVGGMNWSGGVLQGSGSGGYVIQAKGVNATGLYMLDPTSASLSTGGLPGYDLIFSGNGPSYPAYNPWTYPVGWQIVGAPANGTAALPWQ